ncbi:MAG TPA: LLM class flavin-dependent oxidoreductase, partial [Nocardioides sp.]|nr:LLM class flavin-dependent oxidoreductase [Nocardioides sp.]
SGGRLNPGISVGPPLHWDDVRGALYPDTADAEDFSYARVERLLRFVRGQHATLFRGREGIEEWSDRVEPHSPGLADRLWYGGASRRSAEWAGDHGMNFLTSSVVKIDAGGFQRPDFARIQAEQITAYRERHPHGRVSQGLVVIPTDSASPDQRRRYQEYVEARLPRTREPQGSAQLLFSPDLIGTSDQLAEQLHAHAGYQLVDEVAFALPFSFEPDDYLQLLTDLAERLGPALGWSRAD